MLHIITFEKQIKLAFSLLDKRWMKIFQQKSIFFIYYYHYYSINDVLCLFTIELEHNGRYGYSSPLEKFTDRSG